MSDNIKGLVEEMKAHLKGARDISEAVEKAGRDFTDDERAAANELVLKAQDCKKRLDQAKADAEVKKAIVELGDGIGLADPEETPSGFVVPGRKSIGQAYVESAEYKALLDSVPGGAFTKQHRVVSRPVGFKNLIRPHQKALVTGLSDTSGGAFVQNDNRGLQVGLTPFQRPLTLRDLVTGGTTTSDTIEYVRVTSITNNAAPVAEATTSAAPTQSASTGPLVLAAGGGYKPESGLAVAKVTTPVRTIAHWIPVTKRAISDAAQMVSLIDGFLEYGLEEELEDQMIAGDGTGENFEGLANVSGVQSQAFDTDVLTTLARARAKVRTTGRARPNGILLNPADLVDIQLLRESGTDGPFLFGGPGAAASSPTLWGVPVVETEAVPEGTAYVGDFTRAILWDREQSTITTSDSHGDFFIRNLVAILAEMRAAFGVLQPNAFVEVDLTA